MRRISSILLIIIASLAIPVLAQKQSKPTVQGKMSPEQRGTREQLMLIKAVRHELVTLPYYNVFDWLEFEIKGDSVIVLRGQVVRPTLKSDAENVVKRLEAVEQVVNEIEVLPLSPNDDRIRLAVYRAIFNYNSPLFRYATQSVPPIHIIVKNGRVTLKGVVATKSDSDLANIKARGVSGVFEVTNQLQVEAREK
jgi:hyperosmotically inducible protein